MRHLFMGVALVAAFAAVPAPGQASQSWVMARPIAGLPALAGIGDAELTALSCASPGNCSGGGFYQPGDKGGFDPFVVSQIDGFWATAMLVPGMAALNLAGDAQVRSVSCASAGNCVAVGFYGSGTAKNGETKTTAFVVSQVNGSWQVAQPVPGLAALNTGNAAGLDSVSCTAPGDCAAGGSFGVMKSGSMHLSGFVVSEVNGTWGSAHRVAGSAGITSVSCASPGNCGAAGGIVVTQSGGAWGAPHRITGPAGSTFGQVSAGIIACPSPGNCEAAGQGGAMERALVASEFNGHWAHARELPGTARLTKRGSSVLTSLSCPTAGGCTAGGYAPRTVPQGSSTREFAVPFVVSQNGHFRWGVARPIPGLAALSKHGFAVVSVLSCAAPGACGIGGVYSTSNYNPDGTGPGQVFVTSQAGGSIGAPHDVTSALHNHGAPAITSISCPAAGKCSAGGYYLAGQRQRAFVVSQVR